MFSPKQNICDANCRQGVGRRGSFGTSVRRASLAARCQLWQPAVSLDLLCTCESTESFRTSSLPGECRTLGIRLLPQLADSTLFAQQAPLELVLTPVRHLTSQAGTGPGAAPPAGALRAAAAVQSPAARRQSHCRGPRLHKRTPASRHGAGWKPCTQMQSRICRRCSTSKNWAVAHSAGAKKNVTETTLARWREKGRLVQTAA